MFTCSINGLAPQTTYYVRAYASNSIGTNYGGQVIFSTKASSNLKVTDADGNLYNTTKIGTQIWMTENLRTTRFNDRTNIPNVTDNKLWCALTTPSYCWYNNDVAYKPAYGSLYNWFAVNSGKLCPIGCHVPSDIEWTTLTTYLGGEDVAGNKLIDKSWDEAATNETGFSARPGGMQSWNFFGAFVNMGYSGTWWSSTGSISNITAWIRDMRGANLPVRRNQGELYYGYSVRCLKNN